MRETSNDHYADQLLCSITTILVCLHKQYYITNIEVGVAYIKLHYYN